MREFFWKRMRVVGARIRASGRAVWARANVWRRLGVHRGAEDRAMLRRLRAREFPTFEQWMQLPRVLTAQFRVLFSIFFVALVAGAAVLALQGVRWLRVPVPARGGAYTEAAPGSPKFIQPILATSDLDRDLVALTFAPLFRVRSDGTLAPALATSYEIGSGGRVVTVRLREGATWHDGQPITAKDAIFTVRRIQDPEWRSPLAGDFLGVNVQAVNPTTIRFTLNEPFAPFISNLDLAIMPEHVWKDANSSTVRRAEANLAPIGSGPFAFKEMVRDARGLPKSIRLARNENYFDTKSYLDEIIFKFFNDRSEAAAAFGKNQVGGLGFVPADTITRALRGRRARITSYEIPQYLAVFWNTTGPRPLRDAKVRRALGAAVDRERILREAFGGAGAMVDGPIPKGALGVAAPPSVTFDPVAASDALTALGYVAAPPDVVRAKASDTLAFSLTTVDEPALIRAAERVRSDLGLVGVEVALDIVSASKIQAERIRPRSYDALLIGELVGADPDPYPFWHGSQAEEPGLNLSQYRNKDADRLLEEARTMLDVAERAKRYDAWQQKIFDDAPALFLLRSAYQTVIADDMLGVVSASLAAPDHRLWDVARWYVKTSHVWRWNQ